MNIVYFQTSVLVTMLALATTIGYGSIGHAAAQNIIPGVVQPYRPSNTANILKGPVLFSWSPARFARSYHLQITSSPDRSFRFPTINTHLSGTQFRTTTLNDGSHRWRVRAKRGDRYDPWSTVRTFTIGRSVTLPPPTRTSSTIIPSPSIQNNIPAPAVIPPALIAPSSSAVSQHITIGTPVERVIASSVKNVSGDLLTYVQNFSDRIPRKYTNTLQNSYDIPDNSEIQPMTTIVDLMSSGDLENASRQAQSYQYEVIQLNDSSTGRRFILLSEIQNSDGRWPHAWGLYVYSPASVSRVIVEVPHPLADLYTETIGAETFLGADAKALLIAGAHRNANQDGSADMAHASVSIFQAIHEKLTTPSSIIYQPHGFAKNNYSTTQQHEAVLSAGSSIPSGLVMSVQSNVANAGIISCMYQGDVDGSVVEHADPCAELGATTNVQGISARALGATFLSGELEYELRNSVSKRQLFMRMLVESFQASM